MSEHRHERLIVAGFAAESESVQEHARRKLDRKNLDLVVANDITRPGAGFNTDTNIATVLVAGQNEPIELPLMLKTELADRILDEILVFRQDRKRGAGSR